MFIEANDEDLILRDKLALSRTKLANQHTLLSFVRTGIYFVVTALGVASIWGTKAAVSAGWNGH